MMPKGWNKVILREILDGSIRNGFSPIPAEQCTGYWVLGLGALSDDGMNQNEIKPVEPTSKTLDSLLSFGDFLVSRSNTPDKVGRSIRFKGEIANCSYPDLMMRFRINEQIADVNFIEAFLKSSLVRDYYKSCAAGSSSTMVKINKAIVENTPLVLPSITEQEKIAKILGTWDQAIATTEKLLANTQQQKNALGQQLLFGRKRLPGFNEDWKEIRLSKLLTVRQEKIVPSEKNPLYSLTIENGITAKTDRYNREALVKDTATKTYKLVKPSDIVFNPANLRWGAINISRILHNVVVSPIYEVLFVTEPTKNSTSFLAQYLMTSRQIAKFASMTEGTLVERQAVKLEPFLATKLKIPTTLAEQEKIVGVLSAADKSIETLQQKLVCLKQEKKSLMQQLLTGKCRVKVDES